MPIEDSYLGRGWNFPPSFTLPAYSATVPEADYRQYPGGAVMVSGLDDIQQSLHILFTTRLRERFLVPEYGSDLTTVVFEPLDAATAAQIQFLVETAVLYHEPRIHLLSVTATAADDRPEVLLLELLFEVRSTNSRHNYVYPFYLQEGSELNQPASA